MAEVLGVVGSVIGIAQLAGKIVTTGMKLRGMLKEIQDIPDEILFRLEQLHMLSSTLQQSGCGSNRADAGLTHVLKDNARQQCLACLASLTQILEDLSSRIERRSGARRRLLLARQILRKDELTKIERRLTHSVELLNIANQIYIIDILESQRQDKSHCLSSTSAIADQRAITQMSNARWTESVSGSSVSWKKGSKDVSLLSAASINNAFHLSSSSQQTDIECYWEIGIACITGTLGVKMYQSRAADQTNLKSSEENGDENKHVEPPFATPRATIKITLPRWWSSQVIDCLLYKTQVGWNHLLRTRNNLRLGKAGSLGNDVWEEIVNDNLTALKKRVDQKQLAPWDEFWEGWGLILTALACGSWRICSFLLDCGVEQYAEAKFKYIGIPNSPPQLHVEDIPLPLDDLHVFKTEGFIVQGDRVRDYQQMLSRIDQNDSWADSLLSFCGGSPDTFTTMRRSVWLDEEYYSQAFLRRRMSLAINLARNGFDGMNPNDDLVGKIRVALDQQGVLGRAALDLTLVSYNGTLLHGLAGAIGLLKGHRRVSQWLDLVTEVVQASPCTQQLCQTCWMRREPCLETPLLFLITQSFDPSLPIRYGMRRQTSSDRQIARCEGSIYLWLQSLYDAGVDLFEYGLLEVKRHADGPGQKNSLGLKRMFELPLTIYDREFGKPPWGTLRLINIRIGHLPSHWKFWWSEPTDEFVGDFWDLITEQEITCLRIPGAWVEDQ